MCTQWLGVGWTLVSNHIFGYDSRSLTVGGINVRN
jgi:hypothetical protein